MAALALAAGLHLAVSQPVVVRATTPAHGTVSTYAGGGLGVGKATTVGQDTYALAIHGNSLYVGDQAHLVVRKIDITTGQETIAAGDGAQGSTGDGGPATSAAIGTVWSLAINSAGDLFIATSVNVNSDPGNRIRKVDHATGKISTVAGGGASVVDGVAATATTISEILGMAIDQDGNLVIADFTNYRVRKIDLTTGLISTIAGTGTAGYNGDGIAATSAQVSLTYAVAVDSGGNIFFADVGRIRRIDHGTGVITTYAGGTATGDACPSGATSPGSISAEGLSFDTGGNLMLTAGNCVLKIVAGNFVLVAGNGTFAFGGDMGDGGPATSAIVGIPINAVTDAAGNVYISQRDNNIVRRVDHATQIITTFAGTGQTCGWSGDGGPAVDANFCNPIAIALAADGDVFVTDPGINVVRRIDSSGVITTIAGNGTQGFSGDGGPGTSAQLWCPDAVAADGGGDAFIADYCNHRVRKVDSAGVITTVAGNGTSTTSGDGGAATSAGLGSPNAVAVDAGGEVLVADGSNIRRIDAGGTITTWVTVPTVIGSLAIDPAGDVYAAGPAGIWKVDTTGGLTKVTTAAASEVGIGPQGQVVFTTGGYAVNLVAPGWLTSIAGQPSPGFSGDGGPAALAQFNGLFGIALDGAGDIYVVDAGNRRVRRIQAFSAPSAPSNAQATMLDGNARLNWNAPDDDGGIPVALYYVTPHTQGAGDLPVIQTGSTQATIAHPPFHVSITFTVTATNGWGTSPASTPSTPLVRLPGAGQIATYAGAPATGPRLQVGQAPFSLDLDPQTNSLLIGDGASPLVRAIQVDTATDEDVVAGNDSYGFTGDGGEPVAAAMTYAGGLATCGTAGYRFVADVDNHRIRRMSGVVQTIAGTGVMGYTGDGGPAAKAEIGAVYGLACSSRADRLLYIADSTNGAIRIVKGDGTIDTLWYGLIFPTGVVEIGSTVIEVVDAGAGVIWRLDESNQTACVVAGIGPQGFACNGGVAPKTALKTPWSIAWDGSRTYFTEGAGNRVRVTNPTGALSTIAGTGAAGFSGDGGLATQARLDDPFGLVYASGQNVLYVADTNNLRVRSIDLSTGRIATVAGTGSASFFGEGVWATNAQFGLPYSIATDAAGDEFVVDNLANAVREIDVYGVIRTVAGQPLAAPGFTGDGGLAISARLSDPRGVAVDAAGNVYISDTANNRVRVVDAGGHISTIAGTGTAGFAGDGGLATAARLDVPEGLWVDGQGDLYIADTGNNRIRKLDHATHVITTFAGNGTAAFAGDGGPATLAALNHPRGVIVAAGGDVLISDSENNRIRVVDHNTGLITTLAGTGTAGAGGDGRQASRAQLNFPVGLAFDGTGDLLIADSGNDRIRVVDPQSDIGTLAGSCGGGFAGDGGPATDGRLNGASGVAVDSSGNILVADTVNNRIRGIRGTSLARLVVCQSQPNAAGVRTARSDSAQAASAQAMFEAAAAGGVAAAHAVVRVPIAHESRAVTQSHGRSEIAAPVSVAPAPRPVSPAAAPSGPTTALVVGATPKPAAAPVPIAWAAVTGAALLLAAMLWWFGRRRPGRETPTDP